MRIISGIYKGRILKSPSGNRAIRPTTDRARETLFNILANRMNFENKACLDLFCGTGSFGLEFLSRGGSECTFVDQDIRMIKKNIEMLKPIGDIKITRDDAVHFLMKAEDDEFNIVFADPPYSYRKYEDLLMEISKYKSLFILEHDKSLMVFNQYKNNLILQKKIGISLFSFFEF